jgi:hypothetical protein
VLIARAGTVRPLQREPNDQVVLELSPLKLTPGQPEEHEFDVRELPRPCYLRGFFDRRTPTRVRLVDPPAAQLRVGWHREFTLGAFARSNKQHHVDRAAKRKEAG